MPNCLSHSTTKDILIVVLTTTIHSQHTTECQSYYKCLHFVNLSHSTCTIPVKKLDYSWSRFDVGTLDASSLPIASCIYVSSKASILHHTGYPRHSINVYHTLYHYSNNTELHEAVMNIKSIFGIHSHH